jgi:16S rRNA (guanine527-N7)-methyltransferase
MALLPSMGWTPWAEALAGLSLADDFFPRAERFLEALAVANEELNLTAFDPRLEGRAHVVDSLHVLRGLPVGAASVIDVGTGGGFPGLPVALARPGLSVALLDALRKKQAAVQSVAAAAGAGNARTLWGRAEDIARDPIHRETYDAALCRAVGRLPVVLELTLPFLRAGGRCLLHRGQEAQTEIEAAIPHLGVLSAQPGGFFRYRLPGNNFDRFVICIEKTGQIDDKYPRRPGIPAKRPLW